MIAPCTVITSSFTANTYVGDVGATDFIFTDTSCGPSSIVKRVWDLGDGNVVYDARSVKHIYNYPGVYSIQLQVTDIYGAYNTSTTTVTADYVVRDILEITQIPPVFSKPSLPTPQPFKVSVTSAQIDPTLYVQLYASNSRSIPHNFVPDKWMYLAPTWRFTDKDYKIVSTLPIPTTPIYSGSKQVGTRGEADFYYIDDLGVDLAGGGCALLLTLTLLPSGFYNPTDSQRYVYPSFANSNVTYTTIEWQVNTLAPDYLKITGNYLDDVHQTKWVDKKIPVLITAHSNINDTVELSSGSSGILFSYPATNERGLKSEVILTLSGVPTSAYRVEDTPIHFQATDANSNHTGGFVYANITPLEPIASTAIVATIISTVNLSANAFSRPYGYSLPTFTWISNPESSTLHRVAVVPFTESCSSIKAAKNNLVEGTVFKTIVPVISSSNISNYNLTNFSGVYGMAIDIREQELIAADAESDTIYKYNCAGVLLSSIRLRIAAGSLVAGTGAGITTTTGKKLVIGYNDDIALTPSYVSLDRNYNIWVTLFNAVSVLKFDSNFNYVLAAVPDNYNIIQEDEWLYKPPVVETDRLNNIWVTYAQTLCSALVKYDQYGTVLHKTELPSDYIPVGLAISPSNGVWVANTMHVTPTGGNIQYYTSNGTLVTTITGFMRPSYIMLDRDANVWFTHGLRNIGFIDSKTYAVSSWNLPIINAKGTTFNPIAVPDPDISLYVSEDEELGGLTVDALNRLWVIDSQTNIVHMLSADSTLISTVSSKQIKILPDSTFGFVPNIKTGATNVQYSDYYKSAQATGDWSGNRWLQKYGSDDSFLTGTSAPFTVYDYNSQLKIKTVNENFDTAGQYKSLALPERLNQNDSLFSGFFAAVAGNSEPSAYEDIGEKVYERIANFTQQHSDTDTCSIDQLLSHCDATDVEYLKYAAELPAEIKRVLDIFSIPKEKLRGTIDRTPIISKSVGDLLSTQTAIVTAGKKIFLQNKFNSLYTLITIPSLSGLSVYPLSSFDGTGFAQPVSQNYLFYNYTPVYPVTDIDETPVYIENIIDWNNEYTTINHTVSTKEEWYGSEGLLEKTFNYILTKNLFPDN